MRFFLCGFLVCLLSTTAVANINQEINMDQEISMDQMKVKRKSHKGKVIRKSYKELPAVGPYSVAVQHGKTLYLSGLTAFGSSAQNKSISEQVNVIFDQIRLITKSEGISLKELVKVTVFVTSMDDLPALREALGAQYDGHNPASSIVQVAGLFSPDINVEIEAIFAL